MNRYAVSILAAVSLFVTPLLADEPPRDARAFWLSPTQLAFDAPPQAEVWLHSSAEAGLQLSGNAVQGGERLELQAQGAVSGDLARRFPHLAGTPVFLLPQLEPEEVDGLLRSQLLLSARSGDTDITGVQAAGVIDALYAYEGELGVSWTGEIPTVRLWAPTAREVTFQLFDAQGEELLKRIPMQRSEKGVWTATGRADWNRLYYRFEVEVYVRSTGRIETNVVTDPYSHGLSTDSQHSLMLRLDDADLAPEGWKTLQKPLLESAEDIVLYELHVRDFSISDTRILQEERGTFAAFADKKTLGMQHLRRLADAGLSHVHLLPAFDCATIPENPHDRREPGDLTGYAPDSKRQQQEVDKVRARDGFNWCYDPYHYTVPEGSYSTQPQGVQRTLEFRQMVSALNRSGLRVVMDVVYNHTTTAGQAEKSVLDRIVPDYYQRLDAQGNVETSTCCSNTATEHAMMEKLMVDSLLTWARDYKVDGFRFDLMGHHSRANIEKVRDALQALTLEQDGVDGSSIYLYGEGWNFGEVANDARFVQATQGNMGQGTGVGTFNDRLRDAVRGGAHDDRGLDHVRKQGLVSGLYTAPNAENSGSAAERQALLQAMDLVRAGLAGSLVDVRFEIHQGREVAASEVDYHGQAAAYASDPQEVINYVAAHDNETLWDINQYKLPLDTAMVDRVRVQNLATSFVALAQGIPFFHAGQELLRSKSLDRNSYDAGDWFNPLDYSYRDNGWGRGLALEQENAENWPVVGPLLANDSLRPGPQDISAALAHFEMLLRIRAAQPQFRLRTADEVAGQLRFHNTGPEQVPGLVVMSLGEDDELLAVFNVTPDQQEFSAPTRKIYHLHPEMKQSADERTRASEYDAQSRTIRVPGRTVAVFLAD